MFKVLLLTLCVAFIASEVNAKKFVAYKNPTTALIAMQVCRNFGGHLAAIESDSDHANALAAVTAKGFTFQPNELWSIAGCDSGVEGEWVLLSQNRINTYSKFLPGQPNGVAGDAENCLAYNTSADDPTNTLWDDVSCDAATVGFICEFK
uniref:C-type lectin domain-containing protein n=1 Tax=Anopheles farauti TaxID=69004 RepID=A0A9I3GIM1_9DIPT